MALVPTNVALAAHAQEKPATAGEQPDAKVPPDQLDSLVAPIALYPDPLLAQVLAASTYPLEIIQLQQWLEKNKNVAWVSYPGLENHPSHELAKKYLPRGFGGVLSFGIKGGGEAGSQVVDNFKLSSNLAK